MRIRSSSARNWNASISSLVGAPQCPQHHLESASPRGSSRITVGRATAACHSRPPSPGRPDAGHIPR
jgi:hypothetical protein